MSKKAAKSIRPWSARASRPKASDLFDSHAPHAEGSSASPPSLAVGTRQSVTSLGAGTPARQATVRDSITGPPACDATTEATVSAVHARSTRSNPSGAARAATSTSTSNTADPCDGSASRHGLLAASAESSSNASSDGRSSRAPVACDQSVGARAFSAQVDADLAAGPGSASACSGVHAHRSNARPEAVSASSGATDDSGGHGGDASARRHTPSRQHAQERVVQSPGALQVLAERALPEDWEAATRRAELFFDGSGRLHSAKLPPIEKVAVMTDEYPDSFGGETGLSPHMQALHIDNMYESWEDLCRTLKDALPMGGPASQFALGRWRRAPRQRGWPERRRRQRPRDSSGSARPASGGFLLAAAHLPSR